MKFVKFFRLLIYPWKKRDFLSVFGQKLFPECTHQVVNNHKTLISNNGMVFAVVYKNKFTGDINEKD